MLTIPMIMQKWQFHRTIGKARSHPIPGHSTQICRNFHATPHRPQHAAQAEVMQGDYVHGSFDKTRNLLLTPL